KATRQRVILGAYSKGGGKYRQGVVAFGYRQQLGLANIGQADKTDGALGGGDSIREFLARLEAQGIGRQLFALGLKHHGVERVPSAGVAIPSKDLNLEIRPAD